MTALMRQARRQVTDREILSAMLERMEVIRDTSCAETPLMSCLLLWRIVCRAEDVTGKAEITPRCLADVPFAAPAHDGIPLDESHILDAGRED